MLDRRTFLTSVALILTARDGKAENDRVFRLGLLWLGPHPPEYHQGVLDALRGFGYVEGKNLIADYGFGGPDELINLASEMVRMKADVIHAGSSAATRAAIRATRAIPVVAVDLETDPVASGFASTLAHPGGNLTGFFLNLPEFTAKRLEILKEALPGISHVAALWDSSMDKAPLSDIGSAGRRFGLRVSVIEVRDDSELESAFNQAARMKAGALMVMPSPRLDGYKPKMLKLGTAYRVPLVTLFAHFTADGGLLSYGPNIRDMLDRSATYVDKILKGTNPGDLPIQRPAKFDFVVNLKTANAFHLKVSDSVLARADEIIH
jgi:putative ABC transport system substrate-binding protein